MIKLIFNKNFIKCYFFIFFKHNNIIKKNKLIIYNFKPYNFKFLLCYNKYKINLNRCDYNVYNNIIKLKNFFGIFKSNFNRGDFIFFKTKNFFYKNKFKKNKPMYKSIDVSKKFKLVFSRNIFFLNLFLNKKIYKNKKLRIVNKNFINKTKKQIINYFCFNLQDILIMSNFCLNKQDALFFIRNKFILVNKKLIFYNKILLKNDIINLNFNKSFYFFLKNNQKKYNNFLTKMYKKKKLFSKEKNYFYKNKYKTNKLWTEKLSNNNNIFKLFEIDFFTMSIIIIKYINITQNLNNLKLNYFNLYLTRNYF